MSNITVTPNTHCYNSTKHPDRDNCTYNISWLSQISMLNLLSLLLKGSRLLFMSNQPDWSSKTTHTIYSTEGNLTEFNTMFKSIASSLVTHARSKVCNAAVNRTTWTIQSYMQVRWLWMIFLIALVMFMLIFFITIIWNTRNQFMWKSSLLALLFSDLAFEVNPDLSKMEKMSSGTKVRLETTANGVKLKAHLH